MMQWIGKMMIIFGIIAIALGAVFFFGGRLGLGRLPGDIAFKKGNFTFYFPIVSCIIISAILTILFNLLRLRK